MFADLTFSQKMLSNELLLAYSFCVRTREVTNRGLLDMAHLPLSRRHSGFERFERQYLSITVIPIRITVIPVVNKKNGVELSVILRGSLQRKTETETLLYSNGALFVGGEVGVFYHLNRTTELPRRPEG